MTGVLNDMSWEMFHFREKFKVDSELDNLVPTVKLYFYTDIVNVLCDLTSVFAYVQVCGLHCVN